MTGTRDVFSELNTNVCGNVKFGDGSIVRIEGRGTVLVTCRSGEHKALTGVYFIPHPSANIISLGQLDENNLDIRIRHGLLHIWDVDRRLLARVRRDTSRLYTIRLEITRPVCLATRGGEDAWRWHARCGHLHFQALRHLARGEMVNGLPVLGQVEQVCDGCLAGKQRHTPFPTEARERAADMLDLVHDDLCGPITPTTPSGSKYFLLLVDDMSHYMWLSLLGMKDQVVSTIQRFQAAAEVESCRRLKVLRTDCGGEFTSVQFGEYCAERGVQWQLTVPYSPQQNGVVERRNQTVVSMACSMLQSKNLPGALWGSGNQGCLSPEPGTDTWCRRHDAIGDLAWQEAGSGSPTHFRVHGARQGDHPASQEAGHPQQEGDLRRV